MFNSQKINNDPFPYKVNGGSMTRCDKPGFVGRFDPRPEYDNNPNPILTNFRSWWSKPIKGVCKDWVELLEQDLREHEEYPGGKLSDTRKRHIEHARKVLERIVNVYFD